MTNQLQPVHPLFSLAQPAAQNARSTRNRRIFLTGSGLAHIGFAGFFIIAGMWKIEKLQIDRVAPTNLATFIPPGDSGGGGPPAASVQPPTAVKVIRKRVKEAVQPVVVKAETTTTLQTAATDPSQAPGNGKGGDGGGVDKPADGAGCVAQPCGVGDPAEKKEVIPPLELPPAPKPTIVAPSVVAGLRISGETQIAPSSVVVNEIARDGTDRVLGNFKICLSTDGSVSSVQTLKSTGYPAYDADITRGMRTWRYRAYMIGGNAVPVCSVVTFAYTQ
jgi:hypothetical protein